MGGNTSSQASLSQDKTRQNLEDEPIMVTRNLYGEILLNQNEQGQIIAQQVHYCTSKNEIEKFQKNIEKQKELQKNPNILQLIDFDGGQDNQVCGNMKQYKLKYEFLDQDLYSLMIQYYKEQMRFKEGTIFQMIGNVLSALQSFHKSNILHGSVQPKNILVSEDGTYFKLTNIEFMTHQNHFKNMLLGTEKDCYLSPELLTLLGASNQNQDFENIQQKIKDEKAEIFSLGLTTLNMALLENLQPIYDFDNYSIDFQHLEAKIYEVRQLYSEQLANLVQLMIGQEPNQRPTLEELLSVIRLSQSVIEPNEQHSNVNTQRKFNQNQQMEQQPADQFLQNQQQYQSPQQNQLNSNMKFNGQFSQNNYSQEKSGQQQTKRGIMIQQSDSINEKGRENYIDDQEIQEYQKEVLRKSQQVQQNSYQSPENQQEFQQNQQPFQQIKLIYGFQEPGSILNYQYQQDKNLSNQKLNDTLFNLERMIHKLLERSDGLLQDYDNSQLKHLAEEIREDKVLSTWKIPPVKLGQYAGSPLTYQKFRNNEQKENQQVKQDEVQLQNQQPKQQIVKKKMQSNTKSSSQLKQKQKSFGDSNSRKRNMLGAYQKNKDEFVPNEQQSYLNIKYKKSGRRKVEEGYAIFSVLLRLHKYVIIQFLYHGGIQNAENFMKEIAVVAVFQLFAMVIPEKIWLAFTQNFLVKGALNSVSNIVYCKMIMKVYNQEVSGQTVRANIQSDMVKNNQFQFYFVVAILALLGPLIIGIDKYVTKGSKAFYKFIPTIIIVTLQFVIAAVIVYQIGSYQFDLAKYLNNYLSQFTNQYKLYPNLLPLQAQMIYWTVSTFLLGLLFEPSTQTPIQALINGFMDIIVVQQKDGSFMSMPWHLRFGTISSIIWQTNYVKIYVNDILQKVTMKVDEYGAAYFLYEIKENSNKKQENFMENQNSNIQNINKVYNQNFTKSKKLMEQVNQLSHDGVQSTIIKGRKYYKSLRPPKKILKQFQLKQGSNSIRFELDDKYLGKQVVEGKIYLFNQNTKLVISDIDGTVTKSDILGHLLNSFGMQWFHDDLVEFHHQIVKNNYQIIYLTARPLIQYQYTRHTLNHCNQNNNKLPEGPLIMSADLMMSALKQEVFYKNVDEFKGTLLLEFVRLYGDVKNPVYASIGNKDTDLVAAIYCGINPENAYTINEQGQIHRYNNPGTVFSYKQLSKDIEKYFPKYNLN
ncbi:Protein kinase-like domain [Pseudocohnilembus persalinus]|uniref:Protein kinase-like domain n=1 Tax=Pseudocohnilembus persalinus TaxID=266149 RepID=A0A0V0QJG0_PSEPJ|nr:Protein kinase-like domain [Pseudocohnilembus persalinus]|eukprot:KRX02315.1 Protein kinase-like domain [Pseudocohnilembus persalinus]